MYVNTGQYQSKLKKTPISLKITTVSKYYNKQVVHCLESFWSGCYFFPFPLFLCISFFILFILFNFTILYWFCHISKESAIGIHVFPILNPPPSSLPIPSLWVVQVHQPQASSIVHWTWTGDLFHIWYYTYFNAILPNHPTLSFSHRVQKTVLYISVSFAVFLILLTWEFLWTGIILFKTEDYRKVKWHTISCHLISVV